MHIPDTNRFLLACFVSIMLFMGHQYAMATLNDDVERTIKRNVEADVHKVKNIIHTLAQTLYAIPKRVPGEQGELRLISAVEERVDLFLNLPDPTKSFPSFNEAKSNDVEIAWNSLEWQNIHKRLYEEIVRAIGFVQDYCASSKSEVIKNAQKSLEERLETLKSKGDKASVDDLEEASKSTLDLAKKLQLYKSSASTPKKKVKN